MKFFIDIANLDQIKKAYDFEICDEVTTNLSRQAKTDVMEELAVLITTIEFLI